ncbi:MAG TPA: Flp pilus assembly protein CpaB [Acidimicrobiia bacterium]|nr:Flp pilus assembly protein CpaB [Acidimicrobiia bacterium]
MSRRSPRAAILWLGAIVVAIATAALVATDLAALHRRAHSLGAPRPVAVAARDLPLGTTIRRGDITMRSVHRSQLPAGALSPDAAERRVVAVPVVRGAFVVGGNVAPRGRRGLDGAIPPGMRALRVVARDALHPPVGSSVDVLVTFESRDGAAREGAPTVIAARGVLVLGTDDAPAAVEAGGGARGDGGRDGGVGVTLLVDEHDAPRLAFAAAAGIVTLALAPPEDAAPMARR